MKITTNSNEETINFAQKIGNRLLGGEVLQLRGDLGAGKTQFTKGLAKGLGVEDEVISPTFTIERIYRGDSLTLHHFDFYRLDNNDLELIEELQDLYTDKTNIVAIEWPQNLENALPREFITVNISDNGEFSREIEVTLPEKFSYLKEAE